MKPKQNFSARPHYSKHKQYAIEKARILKSKNKKQSKI